MVKLICKEDKYSIYYDEQKNKFRMYNGFKILEFSVKDLGNYLYRSNRNSHIQNVMGINKI
jgi:hypothetical protein